jgi:hypothetical protein
MAHRKHPEQELQRAIVQHLLWRGVPGMVFFHPANGGWRSPAEAAILIGLGVRPGIPDLILIHESRVYGLELKSERGRLTPAQTEIHEQLIEAGATVATAWNVDQAVAQLERWRLLKPNRAKQTN